MTANDIADALGLPSLNEIIGASSRVKRCWTCGNPLVEEDLASDRAPQFADKSGKQGIACSKCAIV